jgi:hypothetical protein
VQSSTAETESSCPGILNSNFLEDGNLVEISQLVRYTHEEANGNSQGMQESTHLQYSSITAQSPLQTQERLDQD